MRTFLSCVLLLAMTFWISTSPGFASKDGEDTSRYLNESYAISDEFDQSELPYYLAILSARAADIHNERTQEWSTKLFRLSFGVRNGWDRIALEKEALVQLSKVNAILAMDWFPQVESPQPNDEGLLPEDVRADAASHIFPNYWNSPQVGLNGLSNIERQAKHIGETGEYPYRAMGLVIEKLSKIGQPDQAAEINKILEESTNFFESGSSNFKNRYKEFEFFLEKSNTAVTDRDLFRRALSVFVQRISNAIGQGGLDFSAEIRTPSGTVYFKDRNETFLFKAFGMILSADPALANSLRGRFPYLSKYAPKIQYISHGFIHGQVSPAESAKLHSKMYQVSLIQQIREVQNTNPEAAINMAETLTDPGMRIRGFCAALPGLTQKDPTAARNVFVDQVTHLQEVTDPLENLKSGTALAEAASRLRDDTNFNVLITTALERGMRVFGEDLRERPDLRVDQLYGFQELNDLVTLGVSSKWQKVFSLTEQIPKGRLKAYLLTDLAAVPTQ